MGSTALFSSLVKAIQLASGKGQDAPVFVEFLSQDRSDSIRAGAKEVLLSSTGKAPIAGNCCIHMQRTTKKNVSLLVIKENMTDIKTDLDIVRRARSEPAFKVLLETFAIVWRKNGESAFVACFMASYGSEEWYHWWITSVPPGHGNETNSEESYNGTLKQLNPEPVGTGNFLNDTLPTFFASAGKQHNIVTLLVHCCIYTNASDIVPNTVSAVGRCSAPIRDCDQIPYIKNGVKNRDVLCRAMTLLEHEDNYSEFIEPGVEDQQTYLFNSTRNLAQIGSGNKQTPAKTTAFVRYYRGLDRPDVKEFNTVEDARKVVSPYHLVLITWAPRPPNSPIALPTTPVSEPATPSSHTLLSEATDGILFRCTCHFFSRSAVYCEHILLVCHFKEIINLEALTARLEKKAGPGRPVKRGHCLSSNYSAENAVQTIGQRRPATYFGEDVFLRAHGIGTVVAYDTRLQQWKIEVPKPNNAKATIVFLGETEVKEGIEKLNNRNWRA